jgi:hypothetical protein
MNSWFAPAGLRIKTEVESVAQDRSDERGCGLRMMRIPGKRTEVGLRIR